MASIWITYAWDDNKSGDVDFAAQELRAKNLDVKLDRWNLSAGARLWEQIEGFIQDPSESDAWLLYATQASLGSEPCREEYAYALDRALNSRGGAFPVIALFPDTVDQGLIPAGIRTRLYVSLTDPDWKERIAAAASGRAPKISERSVTPFDLRVHMLANNDPTQNYAMEFRPRSGTWSPFIVMVPDAEHAAVQPQLVHGPSGGLPATSMISMIGKGTTEDGLWYFIKSGNQGTPTQSFFLLCAELPSRVDFGPAPSASLNLFSVEQANYRFVK